MNTNQLNAVATANMHLQNAGLPTFTEMQMALLLAHACFNSVIPKINWGAAFFDADAISQLNVTPSAVKATLARIPA